MKLHRRHVVAGTVGVLVLGILTPGAQASPGSPTIKVVTFVTAQLNHTLHLKHDGVALRTKSPTDIRMQSLTFLAGDRTGWHHHPGLVLVTVQTGSVTVWDEDCSTTTYGPGLAAGAVFTEGGNDSQEVTSAGGGTVYVTFVVPRAVPPVFRIEDPATTCPAPVAGHREDTERSP